MTTRHRQTPDTNRPAADAPRLRSDGPLSPDQVQILRTSGRAVAYDPLQIGWVSTDSVDDIDMMYKPTTGPRYAKLTTAKGGTYALRNWRSSDLTVYHSLLNDAAVWQHMPEDFPAPLTREMAAALIDVSNTSNHHEVYAVVSGGTPIGQVRLEFADEDEITSAELSYWLGRAHWGQGHGTAMVSAFAERSLRDHPGLSALTARVHRDNTASAKVLMATGFSQVSSQGPWDIYRRSR